MRVVNREGSRTTLRAVVALLLLLVMAGIPSRAQQQPRIETPEPPEPPDVDVDQAIELSANLVTVTVVVRDASGALVTDLQPSDFTIYENGTRQEVDRFYSRGEVPLRLSLLFDASLSVKKRLDFEQRAASRFFGAVLRGDDQASLVSVSTDWRIEQPLTGSTTALTQATEHLEAKGITSLFGAVQGASKYLGGVDGRRVLLVLSDGYDTKGVETLANTLKVAQLNDVVIYGISPAGAGDDLTAAGKVGAIALRKMCDETGGKAFFPPLAAKPYEEAADLDRIYQRIIEELRAQYVLTYYSSRSATGGEFRNLRIEVDRPGVTVSARKGYYAMEKG